MKKWTIGVDLGGTEIKFGLFDDQLQKNWTIPTNRQDQGAYILEDIAKSIKECCDTYGITMETLAGVGIGVPGPVLNSSVVKHCVNLGWPRMEVKNELTKLLAEAFGCTAQEVKVLVENDANVAALGEMWLGSGKEYNSVLMATLGTGVGGGIVINGKILSGAAGGAGEIGHILCVDEADAIGRCGCGHKGCLEQIASATGIVNYAKLYLDHASEISVLREKMDANGTLTAKDVIDAAKEGDMAALRITDKVFMYLGKALAGICNVINPECVLIGGGVSAAGEYLRVRVEQYFKIFAFAGIEDTPIRLATIGNQAGIAGAAYMIISEK